MIFFSPVYQKTAFRLSGGYFLPFHPVTDRITESMGEHDKHTLKVYDLSSVSVLFILYSFFGAPLWCHIWKSTTVYCQKRRWATLTAQTQCTPIFFSVWLSLQFCLQKQFQFRVRLFVWSNLWASQWTVVWTHSLTHSQKLTHMSSKRRQSSVRVLNFSGN